MKNKKTILGFTLTLALLIGVFGMSNVSNATTHSSVINDFESCAKVYGVQESAPVRCTDLKTGKVYIQGQGVIKGDVKQNIKPVADFEKIIFGPASGLSQETIEKYRAYCANIGGSLTKNSDGFLICDGATKNIKNVDANATFKSDASLSKIKNFEDCIAAGFPMMKSLPAKCQTPDGRVFIQKNADDGEMSEVKLKAELEAKLKANVKARMVDSDENGDEKEVQAEVSADVKADINQDGKVGFADLRKLMSLWGKCQDKVCAGDLNNDLQVDYEDIQIIFKSWTEANEKGMTEKCLTLKDGEMKRSCFWSLVAGNDEGVKEKKETIKAGIEKVKPELKGNVEVEKKIENYLFHMDNTLTRISEVIAKLNTVVDKLEARIKIIEETGKDLTNAKKLLTEAKSKLDIAGTELVKMSADSEKVGVENKTEFFAEVRATVTNVKEARSILEKIVLDLKTI